MIVKYKKLIPEAIAPMFATEGAACMDLTCVSTLVQGDTITCTTGIAFEVPEGYVMLVYSRSGHGFKQGLRLVNCVGVIDSDYRGEVMVKLRMDQEGDFNIKHGDRVAQAMLVELPKYALQEVEELSDTARGIGGFGSTNK